MLKRFTVFILSLSFALFTLSMCVTQNKVLADEEAYTEDTAVEEPIVRTTSTAGALQGKTYFDGVNTFANSRVLFKLTTKDNVMAEKIEYRLNDSDLKVYNEPFAIESEGKHVITYFGTDKLGNKEDEKMFRVTIDNKAPEITLSTSKPVAKIGNTLYTNKATGFTINATDALSGVESTKYSIAGRDYIDYVAPFNIATDGEVELRVKSIDRVANLSEVFSIKAANDDSGEEIEIRDSSVKLFIDNIAPKVSITPDKELILQDDKAFASVDYKYSIAAEDNESGVASVLVRLDGKGDFVAYKEPISFTTNGNHLIEARALDKVGNISDIAVLSVFVDITPPQSTIETVIEN